MTTEPKPSVARRLFALSRNVCYYERCEEKLASPNWPRLNCDIAHIAGENSGSARYDARMSDDERRDFRIGF